MKIGVYSYHPFPHPIFGQTVRMINILKYLSKSHKVIVYSPYNPEVESSISVCDTSAIANVKMKKFDFQLTYRYTLLNDFSIYRFLKNTSEDFDILQLENSAGTLFLMKHCNFPKVGVFHGAGMTELSWKNRNLLYSGRKKEFVAWSCYRLYLIRSEKTLAKESKHLIVTSESVRKYAEDLGADPEKISILRNGVDLGEFERYSNSVSKRELRKKLGIPSDSFVFVFHGSFYSDQNIEAIRNIIKIRTKLRSHQLKNKFYYVIVGGPVKRLEHSLREDMGNVLFAGYVKDVKPYLLSADCGIAPYPRRAVTGGRLKIIEFLAAGLPVITTKAGIYGFEELIEAEPIYVMKRLEDLESLLPLPDIATNKAKLKDFDWSITAELNEKILIEALEY